jgi:hypothetical protein
VAVERNGGEDGGGVQAEVSWSESESRGGIRTEKISAKIRVRRIRAAWHLIPSKPETNIAAVVEKRSQGLRREYMWKLDQCRRLRRHY